MRTPAVLTACVALSASLLLTGCAPDPDLNALRADPMFTATPAAVTSQTLSEQTQGSTLGIAHPASVQRVLQTTDPTAVISELDKDATTAGWKVSMPLDLTRTPPAGAVYERTVEGRNLALTLACDGDRVVVALEAP